MFLKTKILNAITFNNRVKLPLTYWLLVSIRFILTLLPQRGYLHPDEYFQNVEIIAGEFSLNITRMASINIFINKINILQVTCSPSRCQEHGNSIQSFQ